MLPPSRPLLSGNMDLDSSNMGLGGNMEIHGGDRAMQVVTCICMIVQVATWLFMVETGTCRVVTWISMVVTGVFIGDNKVN